MKKYLNISQPWFFFETQKINCNLRYASDRILLLSIVKLTVVGLLVCQCYSLYRMRFVTAWNDGSFSILKYSKLSCAVTNFWTLVYFEDFGRRSRVSRELTNIQGHNCKRSKQTHFLMSMTHLHLEFISYDRICPISAFIRPSRSQDFYFLKITSLIKSLSAD